MEKNEHSVWQPKIISNIAPQTFAIKGIITNFSSLKAVLSFNTVNKKQDFFAFKSNLRGLTFCMNFEKYFWINVDRPIKMEQLAISKKGFIYTIKKITDPKILLLKTF